MLRRDDGTSEPLLFLALHFPRFVALKLTLPFSDDLSLEICVSD